MTYLYTEHIYIGTIFNIITHLHLQAHTHVPGSFKYYGVSCITGIWEKKRLDIFFKKIIINQLWSYTRVVSSINECYI